MRKLMTPMRTYGVVVGVVAVLMVGFTWNRLWANLDFWLFLGPVREFARHPLHPEHPLIDVVAGDSYMSPYTYVVGLATRVTDTEPTNVLAVAGLVNLAILVGGLHRLTATISSARWAPTWMLVFTLVAWGWMPLRWSGYFSLNSLGTTLPLGSTFAAGVGLFALAELWRWLHGGRDRSLLIAAALSPIVLLSHQMTGLWVTLIAAGWVLAASSGFTRRSITALLVAAAASVVVVMLWPFFSMFHLLTSLGGYDALNAATYHHVLIGSVLVVPGAVLLGVRLRNDRRDPLAIAALGIGAVFAFGWVTDRGSLGRLFPGLILLAHLAMADWVARRPGGQDVRSSADRRIRIGVAAVVALGIVGTAPGWIRAVPRSWVTDTMARRLRVVSYVEPNLAFANVFGRDDVVAATGRVALAIGAVAAKVVAVETPQPFVADADRRRDDVATMLDPATTPTERNALVVEYHPGWFVVDDDTVAALLPQLPGAMVTAQINGTTVIRLAG